MIKSIKKVKEGQYIINDDVIVHDFEYNDNNVTYKIEYDENEVSEEYAKQVGDEFVMRAIHAAKK